MRYVTLITLLFLVSCGIFKGPKQREDRSLEEQDSLFSELENSSEIDEVLIADSISSEDQVISSDFIANEVLWLNEPFSVIIDMETDSGNIAIALLDATPLHRDNFKTLADKGYFDGLLFHRVINEFVVQGGDPESLHASPDSLLGNGGPGYEIDQEIQPHIHHYRGAIGAARESDDINPLKRSSGSQFYFVTGKMQTPELLESNLRKRAFYGVIFSPGFENYKQRFDTLRKYNDTSGMRMLREEMAPLTHAEYEKIKPLFTEEVINKYDQYGGTPHLDGNYTVFGFVLSGYEVVNKIQKTKTNKDDRPVQDIKIIKARSRE